ncbi:MAG: ClpXP protease specificity-enhancing factor [Betaproteobacteria bacterium]|jgi:stringent starvation protein B|nr:ClpXP protease specificity-enhancing factor [Betaproteobacteria bacterium]NBR97709.1 ClpXP protease specificity-enhancing factor [Betaproteobacteria bacterium]NBS92587.1 ClpXP protease specificity-enhancing factor [Betaproteobacteria bacterium]NBT06038.1 ClpXP protease specificity-enhancing factor [Betaproteobacteria bacterium]NBU12090.1 ClpXP protease specificity-enhancing factor [Betaproteobacteria bacterium]
MTTRRSTRPYMIRAIYEWCSDCGETPFLSVRVSDRVVVPREYVRDGEIVLNVSASAIRHLVIANDAVTFSTRFGGVSHEVFVPIDAVAGIFSRESGQGMFFEAEEPGPAAGPSAPTDAPPRPVGRPKLHRVK